MVFRLTVMFLFLPLICAFAWKARPGLVDYPGQLELIYIGPEKVDGDVKEAYKVKAHQKYFYVYPKVVIPSIQSMLLLQYSQIKQGEEVLDLGTGSGIQAIFAAEKAKRIVATDISEQAVKNARYNAKFHGVENKITVVKGDLFAPVNKGDKFDVIINNIDYPYNEKTQYLWKVHERFFKEVKDYLKPGGRIYYQSGWVENIQRIHKMAFMNGLYITEMHMFASVPHNREPVVFIIRAMKGLQKPSF